MNDKENDKLGAFADFEQLPPLENKPSEGPSKFIANPVTVEEAHLTEVALKIAWAVLQGNISLVLSMPDPERQALAAFLSVKCNTPAGMHPGGVPGMEANEDLEHSPTPSDEAAAKIVQTPEEKEREQEFLDALGI